MPMSTRYQPYQYKKGQMYDPFQMANIMQPGIAGKTAGAKFGQRTASAEALGQEFSWLYGGRPLTGQEIQPLLGRPGYDPRMGTIGGMRSLGEMGATLPMPGDVTPRGGVVQPWQMAGKPGTGGARYAPLKGFGPMDKETGQPMFPYGEVGPTLQTRQEYTALEQAPYELAEQYRRIADQGIYGPAGMHQIVSRGIQPQMERTKRMTTEALTQTRAARQQTVAQGAQMLGKKLGGQFASQPGLAMKLMGDQIIAPSLAREMEMSIDLKTNEMNTLNALEGAIGDLLKANQESKMMGLAGVQDIMGFLQQRVANRWWDLSMENKFGWSPERTAAARTTAEQSLMALQQKYNLTNMKMQTMWQDWLNEQTYMREEYGGGDFDPSGWQSAFGPFGGGEGGDYRKLLGG